jgi:molecular chaperone DnaK
MTPRDWYVGIDLGTTNSTAALFDGEQITIVRNAQGGTLTPSVVRLDARGAVTVGTKARRFLDADPENTRGEFKRLMGTAHEFDFPACGQRRRPEGLAAEVLKALRGDVLQQTGIEPEQAVISVPALFELPQSVATTEAARLAGFTKVELIQEPVASALASGWRADDARGKWLVYDLGGGTFDVSLLESADGFLRVVGHDGDNFLGGRDIDNAVVDWAVAELERRHGVKLTRSDPRHAAVLRRLKQAAEEAKIELSRSREAVLELPPTALATTHGDGEPRAAGERGAAGETIELQLDRVLLEKLARPVLERSLAVCERLLASHGLGGVEAPGIERIVLVGGPTAMPMLRRWIGERLRAPVAERLDAMTLVAQGAALFAATSGLAAVPPPPPPAASRRLWLQFPGISSDLSPHVLGRLAEEPAAGDAAGGGEPAGGGEQAGSGEQAGGGQAAARPATVTLVRDDSGFSTRADLDSQGVFVAQVELAPRRPNLFHLAVWAADGSPVVVAPQELTIVHGVTVTDPPLSRGIGVALADDHVEECFARGTPLPARRTLIRRTVEAMAPRSSAALKIPIVQGDFDAAHLCRLVGTIEVAGSELRGSLPSGADVEITLEVDRGGRLAARAHIPGLGQDFQHVAHLVVPEADPATLTAGAAALRERLNRLRTGAFSGGDARLLAELGNAEAALAAVAHDAQAALGGDADAAQKARRTLLELDALITAGEDAGSWPELQAEARSAHATAALWVSEQGDPIEQRHLSEAGKALAAALDRRQPAEVSRQLRLIRRLGHAAYLRQPDVWIWEFDHAAARAGEASDAKAAGKLVAAGRKAVADGDRTVLRGIVERLVKLLPADAELRRQGYDSGVQ